MKVANLLPYLLLSLFVTLGAEAGDLEAGKKIYTGKCARCHKLRDPNKYDEAAWDKWMGKMNKKAKLTDEQSQQLAEYIQTLRTPK
ncbi:MAG: c-type cytochrome [Verrucomicrobiota bacterium]